MPQATPDPDDRPLARTLLRSALVALTVATTLLVMVVRSAEYGVDPTGMGRLLGLTEMGRVKMALAREAQGDVTRSTIVSGGAGSRLGSSDATTDTSWRDSMTVTLAPGKGIERLCAWPYRTAATTT